MVEKERKYPSSEVAMIRLKLAYGYNLSRKLEEDETFLERLIDDYHGSGSSNGMTVVEILTHYLLNPNIKLSERIQHPFIQAFLSEDEVDRGSYLPEQRQRVIQLQEQLERSEPKDDFNQFVTDNFDLIEGGFRALIYKFDLIPPLGDEAELEKRMAALNEWRAQNPELVYEIAVRANQVRAATTEPIIYTSEVLGVIQRCFDQNMTYEETAQYLNHQYDLKKEPFYSHNIQQANFYHGLRYSPEHFREIERAAFLKELEEVYYQCSGDRTKVQAHFSDRFSPRQVRNAIDQLGLRTTTNWRELLDHPNGQLSLNDILIHFLNQENSNGDQQKKDLYHAFLVHLEEVGIKAAVTFKTFEKKYLRWKKQRAS